VVTRTAVLTCGLSTRVDEPGENYTAVILHR